MPPSPRKLGPGPCTGAEAFAHGAAQVVLRAAVGNAASQEVARRAGFRPDGVQREGLRKLDGTRLDAAVFLLDRA